MTGKCENCSRRDTCRNVCGAMFGFCSTDYKPITTRADFCVNVNSASRAVLEFADALEPWDGVLSDMDYSFHMRNVRDKLRESEAGAWDVLRETRSHMMGYDRGADGDVEVYVAKAYAEAIKALYLVIRNYWHD